MADERRKAHERQEFSNQIKNAETVTFSAWHLTFMSLKKGTYIFGLHAWVL